MADQQVDIIIPNIEKNLNGAWNMACGEKLKEGVQKNRPSKACLFTLVIYAHEERRVNYLQELIDTILDKFPCRIIFIQADTNAKKSFFHVSVSNVISGESSASVACDQIVIKTSFDQIFRVPFVVIPHIVPDLPVYLLWGQNPFEEKEIFPHLQPYASRVIFDSECSDNLCHFCREMQTSIDTLKMDVMDISWALVSNWRDLLIQIFDTNEKIEDLKFIKSVVINYNGIKTDTTQHPEIRALYLQAWLACCLDWKYHNTEAFEGSAFISYVGPNHPTVIALSPQEISDVPPGSINSIEITISNGNSYYLARKQNISQVVAHISSKDICELPFSLPLPNVHRGMTFMREIFFSKLGDRYHEMLKMVSQVNYKIFSSK